MNRDSNWNDKGEVNPLDTETHARVISFQPPLNEVIALTENGLYLVKLRSVKTIKHFDIGQQVCISIDENEREEIESVLRIIRYKDLSGQGKNDISQIIGEIIPKNTLIEIDPNTSAFIPDQDEIINKVYKQFKKEKEINNKE